MGVQALSELTHAENTKDGDFVIDNKRESKETRNKQMLDDYNAGMTVKEISNKYGLCLNRCYNILQEQGYDGYKSRAEKVKSRFAGRNQQILNEYRDGVSAISLAEKYNMTRARIYMILSGIDGYKSQRESGVLGLRQEEIIERNTKILVEVKEHPDMSIAEIAAKYNISPGRAYDVLHQAGIYRNKRK